ncbi:MAG: transglycosylase domain-containing protein [Candidatus Coproplasma sp.]
MKKLFRILAVIALISASVFICATGAYFVITSGTELDESKLIDYGKSISVYDCQGEKIESASVNGKRNSVTVEELSDDTINAFIASEDRNFYAHNGLNYKRMLKALYKNITTFSFKEGASTISQQLIKNTHLYNDKTISRKLKEIKLTKKLEKIYSKDAILEMYLNTIYFGHNCYGLQNAANFYFDKDAENLSLEESATLVGLLTSPNNYSPFKNMDKCISRRNTVLKNMYDCAYISENQYKDAVLQPINAVKARTSQKYGDYLSCVFDELEEINLLNDADISGCKIHTFMDKKTQNAVENMSFEYDSSAIVTDRTGVLAYKSSIGGAKRQPGSTIKPLLVYAPAIEEKIIHPFTKITDEEINFNGYSPENYDKKYHGKVTVAESIMQSYNIPAVKTLNALTINKAERYANLMEIKLDDQEKNLSLALGGMKYGLSLKDLCDCYSVFPNGGNYNKAKFIKSITDENGKEIYRAKSENVKVFSDGTCSLMNRILVDTTKTGTAKKLKNFNFDIAVKTGTCGNSQGNTDAYAVGYTSDLTFGIWLGDKENKRLNVTGGGDCCKALKEIINSVYENRTPERLDVTTGTQNIYIDREEYENTGKIVLADSIAPPSSKYKVNCLNSNLPTTVSTRFSMPIIRKPSINVNNNKVNIILCQTEYYSYLINRDNKVIYDDLWKDLIEDTPDVGTHKYTVTPYYFDGKEKHFGKTYELERIYIGEASPNTVPDIAYKDWYNQ